MSKKGNDDWSLPDVLVWSVLQVFREWPLVAGSALVGFVLSRLAGLSWTPSLVMLVAFTALGFYFTEKVPALASIAASGHRATRRREWAGSPWSEGHARTLGLIYGDRIPRLVKMTTTPLGGGSFREVITFRVPAGMDVTAFEKRTDGLRTWLQGSGGVIVTRSKVNPREVEVTSVQGRPLDEVEHAPHLVDVSTEPAPASEVVGVRSAYVRMGRSAVGDIVGFDLMRDPYHLVIQGQTRSGKSVATYSLLSQVAAHPEVRVAGIDPTGLLLSPFARNGEPWVVLGSSDEQVERYARLIASLVEEMGRRLEVLHSMETADKLEVFSRDLPLLAVVLEEYPGIVQACTAYDSTRKPAERVGPAVTGGIARLVAEGAKVGIRVMLLAQRADASILGGAMRSNFPLRMSLRVDNNDAVRMLHPQAPEDLVDESRRFEQGEAIWQEPGAREPMKIRGDLADYPRFATFVHRHYMPWLDAPENLSFATNADVMGEDENA